MNERITPQSLQSEQSVLGAMLLEPMAVLRGAEMLTEGDFYRQNHRLVFRVIVELQKSGVPVDFITVAQELTRLGQLEESGGVEYLSALIEVCPSAANFEAYARPVEEKSVLRGGVELGQKIQEMAYAPDTDPQELLAFIEKETVRLGRRRKHQSYVAVAQTLLPIWQQILTNYHHKGGVSGVPSGFTDLDERTTGFHAGNLVIVAARPGMGKSSFGLQIAENIARESGKPALMNSLEMSLQEVSMRLIAQHSGIDIESMRRGYVRDGFAGLAEAFQDLAQQEQLPLHIDPTRRLTVFEIRARANRLAEELGGISVLVVDYLQRIQPANPKAPRHEQVGQIAQDLKSLAGELGVPLIALAQVGRQVEERDDKRPMLSDLRESGDIENEADLAMFLYRQSYYDRMEAHDEVEEVEVIIGKNRQGKNNCTITLGWVPKLAQFLNYTPTGY